MRVQGIPLLVGQGADRGVKGWMKFDGMVLTVEFVEGFTMSDKEIFETFGNCTIELLKFHAPDKATGFKKVESFRIRAWNKL